MSWTPDCCHLCGVPPERCYAGCQQQRIALIARLRETLRYAQTHDHGDHSGAEPCLLCAEIDAALATPETKA